MPATTDASTATQPDTPITRPARRVSTSFWPLLALLLGFALRLYRLGGESLWYDETVSVYLASQPLADLIAHTARDIHPPAYYLLLHLWRQVALPTREFGLEFLYAWPSLCLDILLIALTYAVARRVFGAHAARWAIALALIHPTQLWFAQEVRMYALGAFLLLLTLWAVAPILSANPVHLPADKLPRRALILYPIAALLGLYTLYYFLFWLVILGLCVIVRLWRNGPALRGWLLLQLVIVAGWLPWLPTFYRQATSPPVPAWRIPWHSAGELITALTEALAAIWFGHITPTPYVWPWALSILIISAVSAVYAKYSIGSKAMWLLLCFGPLALLFAVSIFGPPIYHVRYVATYAPLFVLLFAALLDTVRVPYSAMLFSIVTLVSAASFQTMWTQPQHAADDHRTAVAMLAEMWRPGDAILVNAGWAYTALAVYWPDELPSPASARPPEIYAMPRLTPEGVANSATVAATEPLVYRSGSVDGDANLGWQLPESDFFALSRAETIHSLAEMAAVHPRIWRYRIYDTVSDPDGVIRQWLEENTVVEFRQPIPGRDYLLLERYRTRAPSPLQNSTTPDTDFRGAALRLSGYEFAPTIAAGETLYLGLTWEALEPIGDQPAPATSLSLRLYDLQGQMLSQKDSALVQSDDLASTQILALPIPAATQPGAYQIGLVVYSADTLEAHAATDASGAPLEPPLNLGELTVAPPNEPRP